MRAIISLGQLLLVLSVFINQTNALCGLSSGPAFQGGTIRVSIEEADTAFGPDITRYRKFIGLTDARNSVNLTITHQDPSEPNKIDPSGFILEYLTDAQVAGGGTQTGFFIRPVSPISRDENTVSTILEYTLACKPTDPNNPGNTLIPVQISIVDSNDYTTQPSTTPSNSALCTNCRSLNLYAVVSLLSILSVYL